MRNLKKFLALVLAMVMAFSLMVTVNAATTGTQYGDVDGVTPAFEEAVDVLTGMKVFQGDSGNFKPAANITRAEVAAIIYRLVTGDVTDAQAHLYTTQHPFTDVRNDAWYAGYVGYLSNAQIIKGTTATTYNPSASVTGYEALAMILRAVGYDKKGEFTGATWRVEVASTAKTLGILQDVDTTIYGGTLHLAARRDVVASLLFRTAAYVPMVVYTPAFGYQPYGMLDTSGGSGSLIGSTNNPNPTLGLKVFGLTYEDRGIVVGNEQTGERTGSTIMGFGRTTASVEDPNNANIIRDANGNPIKVADDGSLLQYDTAVGADNTAYTAATKYLTATGTTNATTTVNVISPYNYGIINTTYGLATGINLLGHNLSLWYDNGTGTVSKPGNPVYAYYDNATTAVVKADNTNLTAADNGATVELAEAISAAGFKVNATKTAVFNNSFGKFGSSDDFATPANVGNGEADTVAAAIASPVKLYKIISNNPGKVVDAVISLNIETSRITEANVIRNVPTLGMPVGNDGTNNTDEAANWQLGDRFIEGDNSSNTKLVGTVDTGVIAQAALVGNSTKTLGDYEMGIHITGTKMRDIGDNEAAAINDGVKAEMETSYYLLNKVTATVEGKVVAYNANLGTVTLDNGTVLNRSKFYNTVVDTTAGKTRENLPDAAALKAAVYALPQSVDADGLESYNFANYKFYTDYEGKYLGAERTYGNDFLYATYVDYDQAVSSAQYTYKVTGVDVNGEVKTLDVSKFWADDDGSMALGAYSWDSNGTYPATGADRDLFVMTGTNNLGVPFRDTIGGAQGTMNYIGLGVYKGMTIGNGIADPFTSNTTVNLADYAMNMQRLGIYRADESGDFENVIYIGKNQVTLGVVETTNTAIDDAGANSKLFFNENTKFILVDGYGTANIVHEVYNGISALKGDAKYVTIDFKDARTQNDDGTSQSAAITGIGTIDVAGGESPANPSANNRIVANTPWNEMTYFTKSPFTYDQSGDVAEKVDTIILPKDAVVWNTDSATSYYMGNPTFSLVSSHAGLPIYQYTIYNAGNAQKVWLTNAPTAVKNDTFLKLGNEVGKTDSGEPVYTATFDPATDTNVITKNRVSGSVDAVTSANPLTVGTIHSVLTYSAMTRDAQAGTFTLDHPESGANSVLLRVVGANVTNLNAADSPKIGAASGYVWPDITDVATLNAAASIAPVTSATVRVAIEYKDLQVSQIYVCWDQNVTP